MLVIAIGMVFFSYVTYQSLAFGLVPHQWYRESLEVNSETMVTKTLMVFPFSELIGRKRM